MDILNLLSEEKFDQVDDFLTFISIYDDKKRTREYKKMLRAHREQIEGKVCLEAGCGMGIMSEYLVKQGAAQVYAVEVNPHLYEVAKQRLEKYPNVHLVHQDIATFIPPEPVDFMLHEFFGQMLYDEDLYTLDKLRFSPKMLIPNTGVLKYGLTTVEEMEDEVITLNVLQELDGVVVAGLFDESGCELTDTVTTFEYGKAFPEEVIVDLSGQEGDLLYLGLEIFHDGAFICRAGECENWSYGWTYRSSDRFKVSFPHLKRCPELKFEWID